LNDRVAAEGGDIEVVPLQHATLRLSFAGKHIYVDPWSQAPLSDGPKADLVLVTDIHGDHLDPAAIESVRGPATVVVGPKAVTDKLSGAVTLVNGETRELSGVSVEAVPMYNLKRGPSEGALFHDPGRGNGYIVTLGKRRVYVSGDTECTPEMRALKHIDVAFVCMNLPYTMPPAEAAACVKAFQPKVVYPFHYRGSDLGVFETALAGETAVEVRLRDWYASH
jgi:L-ascorbate metabolism protein UlaG (beta-lactamase superfamily)